MDEVKSVRVRRKLASLDERHGSLDIKVTIYKGIGKRRIVKGFNNGTIVWPEAIYDGDIIRALEDINAQYKDQGIVLSSVEDDCIKDFVRVNTLRERPVGATISVFNSKTGKQESANYYTIVQDPWSDKVPAQRSFGFDPYYLSNGSEVYIKWLTESYDKISYDISGMTSSIIASGSSASVTKIVVDVLPSNSTYPDFDLKFDYNGGSQSEIDSVVSSVIDQSIEFGFTNNGINYPIDGQIIPNTLTYLMNGGEQYSDLNMTEINTPSDIIKRVEVVPPRSSDGESLDSIFTITDNNEFRYLKDVLGDPGLKQMSYSYQDKDSDIIKKIISNWELKVPVYKSQASLIGVGLVLCNPNYQSCLYTNYQSPLQPVKPETPTTPAQDNLIAASSSTAKTKLTVVFPTEFEVKVREDVPSFKIYVGEPPVEEEGSGFIFQDDMSDLVELSPEYIENKYAGPDEEEIVVNELDDAPDTPSTQTVEEEQANVNVENSPVGPGPVSSKILKKSGGNYYIIDSSQGLAGHRLKNIFNDLSKHLEANGYKGAKITSNGIMRDLKASTYPSNPDRAAGSLHGAGLAVDLKFSIPGFIWTSYSAHNINLASDAKLTKIIGNFVKAQGDITWGASWGKGSDPFNGIVKGRGITEYHHMEIRSKDIPKYWAPFKAEAEKAGIDISKCTSTSGLKEAYQKLLATVGVTKA
jgi:hypothetical protein